MTTDDMSLFWELHSDLPREGPGCDEATSDALKSITGLPPAPRILDIGCGPGMQTLVLARETRGSITAVDTHQPFLDGLTRRAARAGLSDRIETINASMKALDFPDRAFDLVWAEGAIYVMGFAEGLQAWKRLLKPNGAIAVTELSWLCSSIPDGANRFWKERYPAMTDVDGNLRAMESTGYSPISHFVLPEHAWWDHYYSPLERRIQELKRSHKDNEEAMDFLDGEQQAIDLYRRCSGSYGYVFYIARNIGGHP
jgi:ubiquinone/menaquinone biosynthesis C-methylase UbiE